MKTEKELKEEIERLEKKTELEIHKIGNQIYPIPKNIDFSENMEKKHIAEAQLKTLQERNTEVKKVILDWFPDLEKKRDRILFIKLKKELLKELGLENGE